MPDTPIGTDSPDYTLVTADLGASIYCKVTATNASGSASADSNTVGPVTAAPAEGSTWDPANKTTNMELSGGNLIATVDDTAVFTSQLVRGTTSQSAGKKYLEVTIDTICDLTINEMRVAIGLVDSTYVVASSIPGTDNDLGFSLQLDFPFSGVAMSAAAALNLSGTALANGDVVGVACDLDAHLLEGVYKNGVLVIPSIGSYPLDWGSVAADTVFPFVSMMWQAVGPCSISLNTTGPFALATLPSGYVAWG